MAKFIILFNILLKLRSKDNLII